MDAALEIAKEMTIESKEWDKHFNNLDKVIYMGFTDIKSKKQLNDYIKKTDDFTKATEHAKKFYLSSETRLRKKIEPINIDPF